LNRIFDEFSDDLEILAYTHNTKKSMHDESSSTKPDESELEDEPVLEDEPTQNEALIRIDESDAEDNSDIEDELDLEDALDHKEEIKSKNGFKDNKALENKPFFQSAFSNDLKQHPADALVELNHLRKLEKETQNSTKSFKAIFDEDSQMPKSLPKASTPLKRRDWDESEEEDLLTEDMSQIFDEFEKAPQPKTFNFKLVIVGVLVVVSLFFIISGLKSMFQSEPVNAQFAIEPLREDRVAFMNKSTGEKNIERYSWEIYYADTLVQTFNDENLFPVFDTEGTYKIVLKVKDKSGNWSEPYSEKYEYVKTQNTTEAPAPTSEPAPQTP